MVDARLGLLRSGSKVSVTYSFSRLLREELKDFYLIQKFNASSNKTKTNWVSEKANKLIFTSDACLLCKRSLKDKVELMFNRFFFGGGDITKN